VEAKGPEVQVLAEVGLGIQEVHSAPVEQEAEAEQETQEEHLVHVAQEAEAEQETQEEHLVPVVQEAEAEREIRVGKVKLAGREVAVKPEGLGVKVVLVG